jgi:transcriptional regulator with XRE-family HTH domain
MLEHTLAGEAAAERLKARRNAALRGAHQRGVTVEELAARLGLSEGWVRQVLAGLSQDEADLIAAQVWAELPE